MSSSFKKIKCKEIIDIWCFEGVSSVFQRSSKGVSWNFLRGFQVSFEGLPEGFQGCFRVHWRLFWGNFKVTFKGSIWGVSRIYQIYFKGCFKSASRVLKRFFQKYFKQVSGLFHGSFKGVSWVLQGRFVLLHGTHRRYPSSRMICFLS